MYLIRWLYEKHFYTSDQNGEIVLTRIFGRWTVTVDGCAQTRNEYGPAMWRDAFEKLSAVTYVPRLRRVLLLGLAGGGALPIIYAVIPECVITAVEHDSSMVEIAHKMKTYKPFPPPRIIIGDAYDVLSGLKETYDLIIIDLFRGSEPAPLLVQDRFLKCVREHLSPQGVILTNVFRRADYKAVMSRFFKQAKMWRFRANELGAFR